MRGYAERNGIRLLLCVVVLRGASRVGYSNVLGVLHWGLGLRSGLLAEEEPD